MQSIFITTNLFPLSSSVRSSVDSPRPLQGMVSTYSLFFIFAQLTTSFLYSFIGFSFVKLIACGPFFEIRCTLLAVAHLAQV